ncbi:VWFA domain-containing protein [Durusdinium trenchii]|uniref:VWFA domain-containing protein n=1 Tax=Durusdinium trenchii TaxID=1381693 RepID=A0ABP0RPE1_9DINO
MKLTLKVELHNEQILSNLYSDEKKIEQLRLELDKLSSKHQSPEWWESTWESTLQFFGGTSRKSADAARAADYARKNYCALQARVNKEIIDHIEEGLNGMQAGHFDVSGSVVSFLELVSSHLSSHLDGSTQGQIERFEGEVKNMFQNRLEKLLKSFDGEDARTAIAELGTCLDFLRHLCFFVFDRTAFHDAFHNFVEGQLKRLEQAVLSLSVGEAISACLDLQALCCILSTRFVLYKREVGDLRLRGPESWKRLVDLQERIIDDDLGKQGEHFAVLEVLPSMPLRDGEIHMPCSKQVKQAYKRKAMRYHSDKQYQSGARARMSTSFAEQMMRKVNEAKEFLECDANCKGFGVRIQRLFVDKLGGLKPQLQSRVQKLLKEQKYLQLKMLLQDIRTDNLIEEANKISHVVEEAWNARRLRELQEELSKLKQMRHELAAFPQIVPENLIKDISRKINDEIKEEGNSAQSCIFSCHSLSQAMDSIMQFGRHLIALGRICTHLRDSKMTAELEVTHALEKCCQKKWGVSFLNQLGMRLGQGKIGDPTTDDALIGRVLLSSFPQFEDVRTVIFNRETSAAQKDVAETLKEILSWEIGHGASRNKRSVPTAKLIEGWKQYEQKFDEYKERWIASELTRKTLAEHIIGTASKLRAQRCGMWSTEIKEKIPELLAGIFALYAIVRSGTAHASAEKPSNQFSASSADAEAEQEFLIKPHCIQVLTLLCLTGYGNQRDELENHLMQIRTGEGKSIALGGGAALLALLGFQVRCICYSKYLSQRDEKAFSTLFEELQLQGSGRERIVYSTITQYSTGKKVTLTEFEEIAILDAWGEWEDDIAFIPNVDLQLGKETRTMVAKLPAEKLQEEILLVDEVDVLCGSHFNGQTHNQVALLESPEVEDLLREIWKNRDEAMNTAALVQKVLESEQFEAVAKKFPDFADIVKSEAVKMCVDLKNHLKDHFLKSCPDYIFDGGKVGYKVLDGVVWDVVKGYRTAFAYLHEETKGRMLDKATLRKALSLQIPCGRFSYAKLGSPKVLGVSGTVTALSKHQWEVMRRFGITSYTVVPSVYGRNHFAFLNQGSAITISTDEDHAFDIFSQVSKKVDEDRAVIVFFRDVPQVKEFMESSYYSNMSNKILGCIAGGVHVIQTFFSEDKSEEVQIQGRTARQGKSGTYSLILADSEVKELGLDPLHLRNMPAERCYNALCSAREKKQACRSKDMEKTLEEANALDCESRSYFNALLEANCPLARDRLRKLYEQLGGGSNTNAYHFICCYDESGSMRGSPWEELKKAHGAFMQKLQRVLSAKVSIIQFAQDAHTVLQLGDVKQAMCLELTRDTGERTHKTWFEPALATALRLMRIGAQQDQRLTPVLVFMTDGSNGDGDCIQTMRDMRQEFPSLDFHAIIFRKEDSTVLRKMVGATGDGHFHVSVDGVKLVETFSHIASSLEYTGRG